MSKAKRIKPAYKNDSGYALLIVLLVLILITTLGMTLIGMSVNSLKLSDGERKDQAVYYIAESGATLVLSEAESLVKSLSNLSESEFFTKFEQAVLSEKIINNFEKNSGETPSAKITVKLLQIKTDSKERVYEITSLGKIGNKTRTVSGNFTVSYTASKKITLPANMGVFSDTKLLLSNGTIEGNVILNRYSSKGVEIVDNPSIKGNIIVPTASANDVFSATPHWVANNNPQILKEHTSTIFSLPPFPDQFPGNYAIMPDTSVGKQSHKVISNKDINITHDVVADYRIKLDQNYEFNDITFSGGRKLTFVLDQDRSIVVNNISGTGHLNVEGKGKLTVYLKGNFNSFKGNFNLNNTNSVYIYLGPSAVPSSPKTLITDASYQFNASIYAKDANINITGSAGVNGHVLTGGNSVKVSGSPQIAATGTVVYAPNAEVEVTGQGILRGGIVSKVFKMYGGARVVGEAVKLDEIPFFGEATVNENKTTFGKDVIKEIAQ